MATTQETIVLSLRLDNSSLTAEMAKNDAAIRKNKTELSDLNKQIKQAFSAGNTASARALQEQITKLELENKKLAKTQKALTTESLGGVQALRSQKKAFLDAAAAVGEADERYQGYLEQAARVGDELEDLNDRLKALDPGERAQAFVRFGQQVAGVFAAGEAAAALFGDRNEALEKIFVRLQAAQTLLAGIQAVADAKKEASLLKVVLLERLRNAEVKRGIVVTEGATVAQRLWNLTAASNPFIALGLAVAAVAAAVVIYTRNTEAAKKAEEERSRAVDGTIIKNKELRDSYNQHKIALQEIENEWKVYRGEINQTQAALSNLAAASAVTMADIQNETKERLQELGGFWNDFSDVVLSGGNVFAAIQKRNEAALKVQQEQADKMKAEQFKLDAESQKERARQQIETDKQIRDFGKSQTAARIAELERERDQLLGQDILTADERVKIENEYSRRISETRFAALSGLRALNAEYQQLLTEGVKNARAKELQTEQNALTAKLAELKGFGEYEVQQREILTKISREKQRQINEKYDKLDIERDLKARTEALALELQTMQTGAQNRLTVRLALLEADRAQELQNTELTERERLNIIEKYRQLRNAAEQEETDAGLKQFHTNQQARLEAEILELERNHANTLQKRVALATEQRNQQLQQDGLTAGQRLLIEQQFTDAITEIYKQNLENALQVNQAKAAAFSDLVGAFGNILQAFAIDSQEGAEFQKAIALVQVGIETAKSIANVISIATAPTPDNILSGGLAIPLKIAAGIGTVFANIARARSILEQDIPQAPTFEHGGAVKFGQFGGKSHAQGGTKGIFSDGTRVEVEKNETFFVLNRKATPRLVSALSGLNMATGGRSLGHAGGTYAAQGTAIDFVSGPAEQRAINAKQFAADIARASANIQVVAYIDDIQAKANSEQVRIMRAVI